METPRAIGLPTLVLGVLLMGSSIQTLFGSSFAWRSLSVLASVSGAIGGGALTLIGVAILQRRGEFAST
jgi:hypothetical protein